ncbi:MAG: DUF2183 domain-containing protein [Micrococcales bacterium]|nr:DUF2183 domain-containing protein [Micrococcales bacterium]
MHSPRKPSDAAAGPRALHVAARIDDAVHRLRRSNGRRRGLVPTVLPFTGYGGPGWVRVLCRVVLAKPGTDSGARTGLRGWRSFTSVPVGGAPVTVRAGGAESVTHADRGGVVDARVELDLPAGWSEIELTVSGSPPVAARIFRVGDDVEFGIVSDIDDTVMVTALPRPFLAAWNSFVLNEHARNPVPGMAVLYERLLRAHPGSPVVYLSTGAWNVAPTLRRFLGRNLYPAGALLLTDWGPTYDRWFRSGPEHKRQNLRRLVDEFPNVRWLLVGDDGQHDEELYGEIAAAAPERIAGVAIRMLSPAEAVLAGGRAQPGRGSAPVPHVSAPDGAGLDARLGELGLV